jgi:hypothetical protein
MGNAVNTLKNGGISLWSPLLQGVFLLSRAGSFLSLCILVIRDLDICRVFYEFPWRG